MIPLKYNTASQEIPLGHFVDSADGDSAETGLTIANTDIKLWKSGATTLANKNSGGATHISGGIYYATLDATDTNTYGPLKIFVHVSGALPVILECIVMEANAYDALCAAAGTGHIEADAVQISGDATAANNAEAFFDGTGYAGTNNVIPVVTTLTGHTAQTGDSYDRLGAPAGASVSADIAAIEDQTDEIGAAGVGLTAIPWNSDWDAEVQSECTDALNAYDPPTKAEMDTAHDALPTAGENADAVWDEALSGHSNNGTAGKQLTDVALTDELISAASIRAEIDNNSTQLAAIVADTGALNDTALPDSVPADGSIPTLKQAVYMIAQFLTERAVSGTTVTVKKVDGSTSLMTFTLDSDSAPTSISRTT